MAGTSFVRLFWQSHYFNKDQVKTALDIPLHVRSQKAGVQKKIASRVCLRSYDHDRSQKSVAIMTSLYGHIGRQFKKRTIRSLHYVGQYVVVPTLRKLALRSLIGQIKWRPLLLHIFVLFLKSLLKKYPATERYYTSETDGSKTKGESWVLHFYP